MFIGHLALGFAAKKLTPGVSLAMLFVAAQWADVLWPLLLALGLEHVRIDPGNTPMTPLDFVSYPYSHSLVALVLWGLALGFVYRVVTGNRRAFVVLAILVVSHWVLDYVTHRPDMPLYPGGPRLGLGLWYSPAATMAVEVPLYLAGLWIYASATRATDRIGRWGGAALAVLLLVGYLAALKSVPPSIPALYTSAIAGATVMTLLSWWIDRHRTPRTS